MHAVRNLARIGFGVVACGGRSSASAARRRPRATRPRRATCSASRTAPPTSRPRTPTLLREHVWVAAAATARTWMAGGSYLVARRIRMLIETWDRTSLGEQEDDHRPRQGRRRAARPGRRVRRARLRTQGRRRRAADRGRRPRAAGPPRASSTAARDAAPRLQLRRRLRRPRPPRRRAVLHRLPARRRTSSSCRCSARWRPRTC